MASKNIFTASDFWTDYSYFCEGCLQEPERARLLIKPFPYNHSVSNVSASLNNARQRDFVKVRTRKSIFIENLTRIPLKREKPENC